VLLNIKEVFNYKVLIFIIILKKIFKYLLI
jgi:hypothetical protein